MNQPEFRTQLRKPLDPGWEKALTPVKELFAGVADQLKAKRAGGEQILPEPDNVLRAFRQPFEQVKVLIVGQDPYPTPGHAIGLSFAVEKHVRPLPKSLQNIYRELHDDVGVTPPAHGDLSGWANQGVLLLNRVLTVKASQAGSHRGMGWEAITEQAVIALAQRQQPLVAILWGADARKLEPLLRANGAAHTIQSPHPSPLSAYRGFFGSKPFSRANELLAAQGAGPVNWQLD